MALSFQAPENVLDDLPQDVIDRLPVDVLQQLRDGVIDRIPDDVVDLLPPDLQERIPADLLQSAGDNPLLAAILIGVGVLAVIVFLWGVAKSALKAAVFAAVVGGAAWLWYFNL